MASERLPRATETRLGTLSRCRSEVDTKAELAWILTNVGGQDPRLFPILVECLAYDVYWAALGLTKLGDPRAIEPLRKALDTYDRDDDDCGGAEIEADYHALVDGLEKLGAPLTPGEREKYYLIIMERYDHEEATQAGLEIDAEVSASHDVEVGDQSNLDHQSMLGSLTNLQPTLDTTTRPVPRSRQKSAKKRKRKMQKKSRKRNR